MGRSDLRRTIMAIAALSLMMLGSLAIAPAAGENLPPQIALTVGQDSRLQEVDVSFGSVVVRVEGTVEVDRDPLTKVEVTLKVEDIPWTWTMTPATKTVTQTHLVYDFSATFTVPSATTEGEYGGRVVAEWYDTTGDLYVREEDTFRVDVINVPFEIWADANYILMEPGQSRLVTVTIRDNSRTGLTYLSKVEEVTSSDPMEWMGWTGLWIDARRLDVAPGASESFVLEILVPRNATDGEMVVPVVVTVEGHPEYTRSTEVTVRVQGVPIAPPGGGGGEDSALPLDPAFILGVGVVVLAMGMVAFFGFTEVGLLMLLWSLVVPLFTRLKRKEVLNQFTRGEIYGFIKANPGVHLTAIKENLGLANGVLAYHLKVLVREEYIAARREGGFKRFYPTDMRVPRKRVHFSRLQLDIVEKLSMHPGQTQTALARMLGESKQVINYNVGVLVAAGVVHVEREGSRTLLFIKDATALRPQVAELVEEGEEEDRVGHRTPSPLKLQ